MPNRATEGGDNVETNNQNFSLEELQRKADELEEEARRLRALIQLITLLESGEEVGSVI